MKKTGHEKSRDTVPLSLILNKLNQLNLIPKTVRVKKENARKVTELNILSHNSQPASFHQAYLL
jgi:hypothetical protein